MSLDARSLVAIKEARRVWVRYGIQSLSDLVLEDLAYAMGIIVIEDKLDSSDARLIRSGDKGLIRINPEIRQLGRKRFALAHELGHWLLHEKISQILACTTKEMTSNYKGSKPEIEANIFAAELLMPQHLFGSAILEALPTPDVINGLAGDFNTTRTASAVRYVELSSDYCVMIMSEKGRVKWWRASSPFQKELWINTGVTLSPRVLAGRISAGEKVDIEVQAISMSEWSEKYPDYAEEVMEAVIPLGQTGAILTMLWLE